MVAAGNDWFEGSIAETYHKYLGPILFEFSASDIAESTARELPGKAKVLEVACGTGISTSHLARHLDASSEIDATDFNEDMLALANKYFPDLPNVRFSQADAQSLPFADETMDAVVCQFGLMFFPDKSKALSEFHRVLKPGGLLALNVWADKSRFPFALIVDRVVASFFSSNPPNMTNVPYSLGTAEAMTDLLTVSHFGRLRTYEVSGPVRVVDYADLVRGLIGGNPTILEIEKRANADVDQIIARAVEAVIAELGPAPRDFKFPAIVGLCRKPD